MNRKVRVIKRTDQMPSEQEAGRFEVTGPQKTREIASTIKLWVSEFKERRRTEEQHSRTPTGWL